MFLIDPTLRPEFQTLPLAAEGASPGSVEWYVDGSLVATSSPDGTVRWPLKAGPHTIAVRDSNGRTVETTIVVR